MKKADYDPNTFRELHNKDLTDQEIAEYFGLSRSWVMKIKRQLGLKKQRTGPKSGHRHPNWKGGRKRVGGYWYIYSPDHPNRTKSGYVLESRLVMEKKLERHLHRSEVVHHLDGNRENNDPTNLVVFQRNAEHLREHLLGSSEHGKRISEGMAKSDVWKANLQRKGQRDLKSTQKTAHSPTQPERTQQEASEPTPERVYDSSPDRKH